MKKLFTTTLLSLGLMLSSVGVGIVGSNETASARTNSCRYTNFRRGDTGTCVRMAQTLLRGPTLRSNNTFTANLAVDGSFGPATQSAAYKFQRSYGLKYDGVVGPQTWTTICKYGSGGNVNETAAERQRRLAFNAAFDATC